MARSKYLADQAVEMAAQCVLRAVDAERQAMKAKQEAEQFNNCLVVQTGVEAAREGYKAAHAGQHATIIGQQAAVWEDPKLPPQDIIREQEYEIRLIESIIDKAAEVAFKAAQIASDTSEGDLKNLAEGRTGRQSALKRRMHLWAARLADILANRVKTDAEKSSMIKKEAQLLADFCAKTETGTEAEKSAMMKKEGKLLADFFAKTETEDTQDQTIAPKSELDLRNFQIEWIVILLADQQVALANYVCALVAWRLPRVPLKTAEKKKWDNIHSQSLDKQEILYIRDIAHGVTNTSCRVVRCVEAIVEWINKEAKSTVKQAIFHQALFYQEEPRPIIVMENISKLELRELIADSESNYQHIDETIMRVTQAIDTVVAKAKEWIHMYMNISGVKALESNYTLESIESIVDQISTLASRVAILAHHVIWHEYSEVEKDDPQVLEMVAEQAYEISKDAALACEYAAQAAQRAGQSVTQLIHDLDGPSQIGNLATQARAWLLLPSEEKATIKNSYSALSTVISSSLNEAELMCWKADTACKAAGNVYEEIELARRDAEQFCIKGIIAAQPISWRSIWPWSFPLWAASNSFKQSEEATKQSSEAVDQVGQAAVLAGQAVALSGLAVAQASEAVAILGQLGTRCPDSHWPLPSRKEAFPQLNQVIQVAHHVGASVAQASQLAAQASQAANNVALAAQTTQQTAQIAQAVQQIEWLKKKRQKCILGLAMILSLASICILLLTPIINPNGPLFHLIITAIGIVAIVDSCLLLASLGENIQKMTRLSHKLLTLICCALLFLLVGFVIFYALLPWIPLPNEMPGTIASILTALLIILPPFITGIVYYQHCTLNNLHPYDVPTSTLES